jgi:hypothetical protein
MGHPGSCFPTHSTENVEWMGHGESIPHPSKAWMGHGEVVSPVPESEGPFGFAQGRLGGTQRIEERVSGGQASWPTSGLSKRVKREMKFRCTVPVGPLRCLARMISDLARSLSLSSSSRL